jgi:hypothetical protein
VTDISDEQRRSDIERLAGEFRLYKDGETICIHPDWADAFEERLRRMHVRWEREDESDECDQLHVDRGYGPDTLGSLFTRRRVTGGGESSSE